MDSRLKKSLSAGGRETRASEDAERKPPEEKFMSAQERRKAWSDEWTQSALPKTPEIPGWHLCWLIGFIACNEMVLYKIPMDLYQDVMLQMHHEKPMEEADKIRVQAENLQGMRDSSGKSLGQVEGEGFGDLDRDVKTPVFIG